MSAGRSSIGPVVSAAGATQKHTARLRCIECGAELDLWTVETRCECGGLLEVVHDLSRLDADELQSVWAARRGGLAPEDRSGVWRRELIAPLASHELVARGEASPASIDPSALRTGRASRTSTLHEGENPTGSFKDRGMTVGVSVARKIGATAVACASTGNTSASLACYAAIAGLPCVAIVPAGKTSEAKLSQALAYGARTLVIRGDFDRGLALLQSLARQLGLYVLNSVNTWRLEGQKSVMFETLEALDWTSPDWIVLPGGNLGNTSAFTKALLEARELGLISHLPRIAVVQAEGAAPFAGAFRAGWDRMQPVQAETVATAIRIGDPVNYPKARAGVQALDGVATTVTDDEIMHAKAVVDRAGIGCEPASAASVAGLRRLREEGVIAAGATVAAILTGHLLKDPAATWSYHMGGRELSNPTVEVEAEERDIVRALEAMRVR
ncbi:MAG: threonine synthase [Chloroflexia bacterium]